MGELKESAASSSSPLSTSKLAILECLGLMDRSEGEPHQAGVSLDRSLGPDDHFKHRGVPSDET